MSERRVKNVANITLLVCDKPHVEIYANRSISNENSTHNYQINMCATVGRAKKTFLCAI